MEKFDIDNVSQITKLNSELELEKALSVQSKLRWMIKDDPSLKPLRKHLRDLIQAYEEAAWLDEDSVTESQIIESDEAAELVLYETRFIQKRKELIKDALKIYDLTQNDLAKILGHRKNYMSELINGIRPLSMVDLAIINRVLKIRLDDLFLTTIKAEIASHVRGILQDLNKPNLKLEKVDLICEPA